MEVVIDGKSGFSVEGQPEDAFAVLVAVSESLQMNGRSIVGVKADSEAILPHQLLDKLTGRPISSVATLEITSADTAQLVEENLREMDKVLPELPKVCRQLAELFQSQSPQDAYEPFHRMADIWAHIKSREQLVVNALNLSLDELILEEKSVAELQEDLNGYLQEALDALRKNDTVLLGDLLEYELAPRAERETSIVGLLKEQAKQRIG